MPKKLISLVALALSGGVLLSGCSAAEPEQSPGTRVGVQLFMWNWNSIARECKEVLGPSGVDWVLTSPPQEHIVGSAWWVHYQPVSYQIESRLGSREEFAKMVSACKEAGVDVIADAVINHMTAQSSGTGWAGTEFTKYEYPGLYERTDFHRCGLTSNGQIQNYKDLGQVQTCELLGLSDLDTASEKVQATLVTFINDLVSLGVAGIRIDAAKHIWAQDLKAIVEQLPEDLWVIQEVIRGGGEPVRPEQYIEWGDVWEFDYANDLEGYFSSGTVSLALNRSRYENYAPSESSLSFISNHDTERNGKSLSIAKDPYLFALATAFMLAEPYGKPMLYSGYRFSNYDAPPAVDSRGIVGRISDAVCVSDASELKDKKSYADGDWVCQHRWQSTIGMIRFREVVADAPERMRPRGLDSQHSAGVIAASLPSISERTLSPRFRSQLG